jgi:hypothetical protein
MGLEKKKHSLEKALESLGAEWPRELPNEYLQPMRETRLVHRIPSYFTQVAWA